MSVEFVKEDENGGMFVVYKEEEATHVILDVEEYWRLQDAYDAGSVTNLIARARGITQPICDDTTKKIQELEHDLLIERRRVAYERSLNEGFRRIFKERSNSNRKLKPKRGHTGYVIQVSAEKEKYGFINKQRRTLMVWETVLQTPYDYQFTVGQVKTEVQELTDLQPDGSRMVSVIGLGAMYNSSAANSSINAVFNEVLTFSKEKFEQIRKENVVLFRQFKFNAKVGYWEVTLTHLAPLRCYHATMMPTRERNKTQKAE